MHENATGFVSFSGGSGPAHSEPTVPVGPNIQETSGKAAPAATYEDMIKTAHDEALFEYYFTSQLAAINATTGSKTLIGRPAIFESITPSPSGEYLLVSKIKRPFSHLIPMSGFPKDAEIWTGVAKSPAKGQCPRRRCAPNRSAGRPARVPWRQDQRRDSWNEARDGGS